MDDGLAKDEHGFLQGPEGDDGCAKVRIPYWYDVAGWGKYGENKVVLNRTYENGLATLVKLWWGESENAYK